MTVLVWVLALLAAAVHILVFAWEALLFSRPGVHSGIFSVPAGDVPAVRLWAFGVGFYNLFLGCGMVAGVVAWASGRTLVGQTLVVFLCLFMVLSSVVLLVADRLAMGRPRGQALGGVLAEGLPPLAALVVLGASLA
jgi:putative membrane protein